MNSKSPLIFENEPVEDSDPQESQIEDVRYTFTCSTNFYSPKKRRRSIKKGGSKSIFSIISTGSPKSKSPFKSKRTESHVPNITTKRKNSLKHKFCIEDPHFKIQVANSENSKTLQHSPYTSKYASDIDNRF